MCGAPKGWRTQKAEKNENVDPKKKDENVTEESPDVLGKDHDSVESDKHFEPITTKAWSDIREPLTNLRRGLEQKLDMDLSQFDFWLQGMQLLEENTTLLEHCVQEERLARSCEVHLKVESDGKINIVNVFKRFYQGSTIGSVSILRQRFETNRGTPNS